jgi:DUF4097 and DUF4098 domain-containing protein YvlB
MSTIRARNATGSFVMGLLVLALSAGCDVMDFVPLVTATKTISEEFKTGQSPKVVIETFNGSIDISDGQSDEVVVEVTKRAGGFDAQAAEANLNLIEVSIVEKGDTITVTARRLGRLAGNSGATVVIAAPKAARLLLKSSNGHIITEGMEGGIDAKTSNAKVEVVEGRGAIDVTTSNGGIEIEAADAVVDARSSNARITFRGSLADKDHQFKSSNGRIELFLPADSQFRFDCSTSNAKVQCDFPNTPTTSGRKRKLAGTVGQDPRGTIVAATSNAGINIHKADSNEN